ncbi:MAG: tRNA-binding protein [Oligoflexales bacterium]
MDTKEIIKATDFYSSDIRIGLIIEAKINIKARKPALILRIDFGEKVGIKTSSAQLTENYTPESIVGKQVAAVVNFSAMRIAGVKSEVLVLAGICPQNGTILLRPDKLINIGSPVS